MRLAWTLGPWWTRRPAPEAVGCAADADCAEGWRCLVEAGVCADRARWGGEPPPEVQGLEGEPVLLDCSAGLAPEALGGCRWRVAGALDEPVAARRVRPTFDDQGHYAGALEVIGLAGGISRVDFALAIVDRAPAARLHVVGPVHEGQPVAVHVAVADHPSDPLTWMVWSPAPERVSVDGRQAEYVFDDGAEPVCVRLRDEEDQPEDEVVECAPVEVLDATPRVEIDGGPFTVEVDTPLALSGTGEAGAPTDALRDLQWDFGDGAQADGPQVMHAWAAPGLYRVRLTARDEDSSAHADTVVAVGALGARAVCGQDLSVPDLRDVRALDAEARRLLEDVTPFVGALVADPRLPPAAAPAIRALAGEIAERPNCAGGACAPWLVTLARLMEAHAALADAGDAWAADAQCLAQMVRFVGPMAGLELDFLCGADPEAGDPVAWLNPVAICAAHGRYNQCARELALNHLAWPEACAPVGQPCGPSCPNACQPLCLRAEPCRPACWPAACTDGVRDGDETDRDCGGGCPPCAAGPGCWVDADCQGGLRCGEDARCSP